MAGGTILEGVNDTYKINISINAQSDIEDALGKSIFESLGDFNSIKTLRTIFTFGLRYGGREKLNYTEAGEIMDDVIAKHSFKYLGEKLHTELNRALKVEGESDDSEGEEGK